MEWISNNWQIVAGTIGAGVLGMYIPFTRGLIMAGVRAMISEAVMKKAAIIAIGGLVESTKNKLDDAWFAEFKKSVEDS